MTSNDFGRALALGALALLSGCNEIAGIRAGDPLGSPIDCAKDADCPAPGEPECGALVGCKSGQCEYAYELDGKVIQSQVPGDCLQRVCDAKGGVRLEPFDADIEDDGKPCTLDTCEGGVPEHTPLQEVPCYEGPAGTEGAGICKGGTQHCDADFQPIGGCEGQILPQPESCLTPEDENCDGHTNEGGEGCVCKPNATSACYTGPAGTAGVGVCNPGTCLCDSAGTGCAFACNGEVVPKQEDCSTPEDDDCDGQSVDPEDGCICVANQTDACVYTGPPGTEGVGFCTGGTHTCDATGKGYLDPCDPVLPNPADDCTIVGDDDCDGTSVDACTGALGWVKASTTVGPYSSDARASSIATDAAGNVYATGTVYTSNTTIDLGGGPMMLSSYTPPVGYVVKRAPDGTHLWSKLLPCAQASDAYTVPRVAVTGAQVALAYTVGGYTCDFGDGAAYLSGIVLVRLDASTGAFVSKTVIGSGSAQVYALAAGSDGVYLGGYQNGTQPFVAKVSANDGVAWVKGFALSSMFSLYPEENRVRALAVLPDGAVAFAGNAQMSTIDLGAGPLGNTGTSENHYYGVLEPDGSLRWGRVFTGGSFSTTFAPSALAIAPNGDLMALGRTSSGLQLDAVTLPAGGYVASFAKADGAVLWGKALKLTSNSDTLRSLSVDVLGHIKIGAYLSSGADLGGGPVQQSGSYIVKLDGTGAHLWTKRLPLDYGGAAESGPLIAPAKDAGILFTGGIYGVQSFDGTMVGSAQQEIVVGKLAP